MGTILAGILGFVFCFGLIYMVSLAIVEKYIDADKVIKRTGKMSMPTKRQAIIALVVEIAAIIVVAIYLIITMH